MDILDLSSATIPKDDFIPPLLVTGKPFTRQ